MRAHSRMFRFVAGLSAFAIAGIAISLSTIPAAKADASISVPIDWFAVGFHNFSGEQTIYPANIYFQTTGPSTIDFGDGQSGTVDTSGFLDSSFHTYAKAGTYTATVHVPAGGGAELTGTTSVMVGDAFFAEPTSVRQYDSRRLGIDSIAAHSVVTLSLSQLDRVDGLDAALVNVTVTDAKKSGYITVYPDGGARPAVSTLNFVAGKTVANHTVAMLGSNGKVDFYNGSDGPIDLIVDANGLDTVGAQAGAYVPDGPVRVLDTRTTTGHAKGKVPGHGSITLTVGGTNGVPVGAEAVVLNIATTDTTTSGYLTAYPSSFGRPIASDSNWAAQTTTSNLVVSEVYNGKLVLYNGGSGSVDFIADLVGYYPYYGINSFYLPAKPARLLDTRTGVGTNGTVAQVGPGQTIKLKVTGGAVAAGPTVAVAMNLTATGASAGGYLTVYPDGKTRPLSSSVNYATGRSVANMTIMPIGSDGEVAIYNGGTHAVDVIADLVGSYFTSQIKNLF